MHAHIAEQWITALESGEYKQGQGQLKDKNNNFCCLGVLCDMYGKAHNLPNNGWSSRNRFFNSTHSLPEPVITWADLKSDNGKYNQGAICLAQYNDRGNTFSKIAQTIRKHHKEL